MIEIKENELTKVVSQICKSASFNFEEDVFEAIYNAYQTEDLPTAKKLLEIMIKNAQIAYTEQMPICQDTGQMVVFLEIGQEVKFVGRSLETAINEGIELGGKEGLLRKSVVQDPFKRFHEGSYGPAIIHYKIAPGDKFKITFYPDGCGCENMSSTRMYTSRYKEEDIKRLVVERVVEAGSRPCPPTIIGVGLGGNLEESSLASKIALMRPLNVRHPVYSSLEKEILDEVNKLNIGPHGFGGKTTALAVNIEIVSCHRANFPVAIAFNCHIGRRKTYIWGDNIDTINKIRVRGSTRTNDVSFEGCKKVMLPLTTDVIRNLTAGEMALLNGPVYTARDAAHQKLIELINTDKKTPFELNNQIIYYVGPTPPKPNQPIGAAGPTTSYRMDPYTEPLLKYGIKGIIGKGYRSKETIENIKKYNAVYFVAPGGAGAFLSKCIVNSELIAFEELGTEAVRKLELKDFPVIVGYDVFGNSAFE